MGRLLLERLRPHACYGGLDLAAVNDLTCFVLAWPIENRVYVYPWFWIPGDDIDKRSLRDNVEYADWARNGHIELTPGNVTDWRFVTDRIKQLAHEFDIRQIGFDRWGARDVVSDLAGEGLECVDIGQGATSFNAPMRRMEELVLDHRLIHTGHPVLRWNVECTVAESDANENLKAVKPDRQKGSKRIDGVVAAIMAINMVMAAEDNSINYTGLQVVG